MGYVLITGGSFKNKGAQSMVFITVNEVRKRFPQKEIVVISDVDAAKYADIPEKDGEFQFMLRDSVCLYGWKYKLVQHRYGKLDRYQDADKIQKNVDMIIDISGYTFGSNFGWMSNLLAAYRAKRAKKYKAPIYYMPQSFGPFEWKGVFGKITDTCIRKWLPYAKVLYAREEEGAELLRGKYGFSNVALSEDIVLQNRGIDLQRIYNRIPEVIFPKVERGGVAVLPNVRNSQYGNLEELMKIYRAIIDAQLSFGRKIYLVRHASEDIEFCRRIKELYQEEERVILLENDLTCIEYEEFVKQFDYLVASRYHAIVHAYKQTVPCLVLGWALKYKELLEKAGQSHYMVDVRGKMEIAEIKKLVNDMEARWKQEAEVIRSRILPLQETNVFDCIGGENCAEC